MSNVNIYITDRDNKIIDVPVDYSSYSFDSQLYNIADSFDVTLADPEMDISEWYGINMAVNNTLEFTGIIQSITKSGGGGAREVSLSGKDRGALITEAYCTKFNDFFNESPRSITEKLIEQTNFYPQNSNSYVPVVAVADWDDAAQVAEYNAQIVDDINNNKAYITRKDVSEYDQGFKALSKKGQYKIDVGDTVFAKLNELVRSVGFDMIYLQNGVLFFGDINKQRTDSRDPNFKLILTDPDTGNNVLDWSITDDISGLYSNITVVSQDKNETNGSATATNSAVVDKKTMIVTINDDPKSVTSQAIRIREDQRFQALNINYTVPDHVYLGNDEVWQINKSVSIDDRINDTVGSFVIYGRTFTYSEGSGQQTSLKISTARQNVLNI